MSEQATWRPTHPPPELEPEPPLLPELPPLPELPLLPELLPLPELPPDPLLDAPPVHAPHWHELTHACVPPPAQLRVAFGAHAPSPAHPDQADHIPVVPSHVLVCVPQLPHACDDGPVHDWPAHVAPHWQLPPQTCVPPCPHARVAFGAHAPSPAQADHADQVLVVSSHVRVCVPQLPHACDEGPLHD